MTKPTNIDEGKIIRARKQLAARLGVNPKEIPKGINPKSADGIAVGREGEKVVIRWHSPATRMSFSLDQAEAFAKAILNSVAKATLAGPGSDDAA